MTTALDIIRYHSGIAGEEVANMVDELEAKVAKYEHAEELRRTNGTIVEAELREQVDKLTKERDTLKTVPMKYRRMKFNAELQEDVRQLEQQLAALAEQNEKQRAFLEFAWKGIPMNEYAFKILEHVMNLPNLADPALNRIRAVGMRMAAQFIEDKYDFLSEEITVVDEILAKADELSKGETR